MEAFKDKWKQDQADHIAEALQELLSNPNSSEAIEDALNALNYAFDTWTEYHEQEKDKWTKLKTRFCSRFV